MPDLRMVVLVKGVPDFREGKVQFKEDNTLNRGKTPTVLNPNDHLALEAAREVQVKHGGTVTIMSMGPPNYVKIIQEAYEICGDKGVLLSDIKFAAADTWATSFALMYGIQKLGGADLVFAGFKSADGETGQTGPQTALCLGLPLVTHVIGLDLRPDEGRLTARRIAIDEIEHCEAPLRSLIVTDPGFVASYRRAGERLRLRENMDRQRERAAADPQESVTVWSAENVGADMTRIGLVGSPTIVRSVDPIPAAPSERTARILKGDDRTAEELAELIVKKLRE